MQQEIEQKRIALENMEEAAIHLERKVETYQKEYSKLKNFTQNLAYNERQNEVSWDQQKNELVENIDNLNELIETQNDKILILAR